jgi:hypothetical protein
MNTFASSTYKVMTPLNKQLSISLIYNKNMSGPNTDPCGTPTLKK